jgi:Domain of unknown function (DUF5615)
VADFFLDQNVSREFGLLLRMRGQSARTTRDLGMERAGDDELLFLAAQQRWLFVTHNAKDFQLLHDAWRRWSTGWLVAATHPGILVLNPPIAPLVATSEIDAILRSGRPLTNELHLWRRHTGWVRRA